MAVVALGASLEDGLALRVNAFLVAGDGFGAALDGSFLGAVGAVLVAVEGSEAALEGTGLVLEGNFADASSPRELGREPVDAGDETTSCASGLCIVLVASLSLGSLEDPGETGPSVAPLKIADGGAADAVLIGDFSGPTGDDIMWLSSVWKMLKQTHFNEMQ